MKRSPQTENGFTMLANEMFDAFLRAGLSGNQWKVGMAIVRKTYGFNKKEDDLAAAQIAEMCDIARPNVATALSQLAARNIINKRPGRYGSIVSIQKDYSRWLPSPGKMDDTCMEVIHPCIDSIHVLDSDRGGIDSIQFGCMESIHTKDNLPKDNHQKTGPAASRTDPLQSIPYGTLVDLYHELMPLNRRVRVITTARKSAIRARWLEAAKLDCEPFGYTTREGGLEAWRQFFTVCAESKFLTGLAPPAPGKPAFVADIDFLFSPSGFAKTLENKYHQDAP